MQRRVVNCTSPSDGQGCGEIVCEGAWLKVGLWAARLVYDGQRVA